MPDPTRDEAGRFAGQPEQPAEPAGPDWSAFEQAGITPDKAEDVAKAWETWQGLNSLDRRQQTLQNIYRHDVDGSWLQPVQAGEEEPDAWEQFAEPEPIGYAPDGTPVYNEPPGQYAQPQFDPRQLQPVFDQYGKRAEEGAYNRVMGELTQMMQQQQITESASAAAQSAGLPPSEAAFIEHQTRMMAQQNPQRAPAEIAKGLAEARKAELHQWAIQNLGAPPAQQGQVPNGPAPATHERPRTEEEAMEHSMRTLDPN